MQSKKSILSIVYTYLQLFYINDLPLKFELGGVTLLVLLSTNSCVLSISYTLSIDLSDTSIHPSSNKMHKKHQRKSALKQGNHTQKGERRQEWHLMILHIVSVALSSAGQDG